MRIRCIALDLDRTTLNSEGHLSERNRRAIERAISSGIQIAVASGRSLDSLPGEVLEIPGIRYAITSNGAAVYDLKGKICGGSGPVRGDASVNPVYTGNPGTD